MTRTKESFRDRVSSRAKEEKASKKRSRGPITDEDGVVRVTWTVNKFPQDLRNRFSAIAKMHNK